MSTDRSSSRIWSSAECYDSYEQSEEETPSSSSPKGRRTSYLSDDGTDRISALPDSLLHEILSFLDMKQVVAMSSVSKRWISLWKTLPVLNFDSLWAKDAVSDNPDWFPRFVHSVMSLRDDCDIHRLHLYYYRYYNFDEIVELAVRRHVKEVILAFDSLSSEVLPSFIFTSGISVCKLYHLCFDVDNYIQLPSSMCMASQLKTLELTCVRLPQSNSNGELVISCPVLENLCLRYCLHDNNIDVLNIFAPQLVTLKIKNLYGSPCKIKISTPKLVSLVLKGLYKDNYPLHNLSSLVNAKLRFCSDIHPKLLNKLLEGLYNATTIELSSAPRSRERSGDMPDQCFNQFINLRCLDLTRWEDTSNTRPIICNLLKSSPYIETLAMEINLVDKDGNWGELFQCIHHLKSLEIWSIKGCEEELKFIEFVLKSAVVLEEFIVRTHNKAPSIYTDKQLTIFGKKILSLNKASAMVKILVFIT